MLRKVYTTVCPITMNTTFPSKYIQNCSFLIWIIHTIPDVTRCLQTTAVIFSKRFPNSRRDFRVDFSHILHLDFHFKEFNRLQPVPQPRPLSLAHD